MNAHIRRAVPDDLEELLRLLGQYREFYECTPDPKRERQFAEIYLAHESCAVFVAILEERIVGFALVQHTFSSASLGPKLILEDLFVRPDSRGKGVGSALLQAVADYARTSGAVAMYLETGNNNRTAQRAYERAGWTREDQFIKYNARGTFS